MEIKIFSINNEENTNEVINNIVSQLVRINRLCLEGWISAEEHSRIMDTYNEEVPIEIREKVDDIFNLRKRNRMCC